MLIRKGSDLTYADVTPKSVYLDRRKFLQAMGIAGAAAAAGKGLFDLAFPSQSTFAATKLTGLAKSPFSTTEKQNTFEDVTHYNNFYEFGTDKGDPAKNLKIAPLEERVYRHRCVEAWSIVVPWIGFSFSNLVKLVEPTSKAQFVAFQSYYDHQQMPQGRYAGIDFPYVEGLRMDEAINPLALLCVGMYGETLPNQDGAPVRMTLPWKYGFKSIKSLVKIKFQQKMPPTTWNLSAPAEYGFYSNVNPTVDHPRWSQAKERRLGEIFKRHTLMFNGYGDQVAAMYSGMDLKKNY
jgi:sulfoxide reductase catalytic subunit YedY